MAKSRQQIFLHNKQSPAHHFLYYASLIIKYHEANLNIRSYVWRVKLLEDGPKSYYLVHEDAELYVKMSCSQYKLPRFELLTAERN